MAGFPNIDRRPESLGFDIEESLRGFLFAITGKTGDDLTELIDRGTELGKDEARVNPVYDGTIYAGTTAVNDKRHSDPFEILRPAELAVLDMYGNGHTAAEIAVIRHVAYDTVKTQLRGIRVRLGAKNTAHALRIAIRTGQLEL